MDQVISTNDTVEFLSTLVIKGTEMSNGTIVKCEEIGSHIYDGPGISLRVYGKEADTLHHVLIDGSS